MSYSGFLKILSGLRVLDDVLRAYPDLTREKALKMLREFGHFAPKANVGTKQKVSLSRWQRSK